MKYFQYTVKILIIGVMVLCLSGPKTSAEVPNVNFQDVRALGMGGAGLTTIDGFSSLIYNPASLAKAEFGLEIINVQANMSKDIIDLIDFIDDNEDVFDDFDILTDEEQEQLLKDMDKFDNNSIGVGVYPKIGVVFKGVAFGVYGTGNVDFKLDKGIFDPKIFAIGHVDVVYSAGYGTKLPLGIIGFLPNDLYVGGALKIINRSFVNYKSAASDADFETVLDSLEENETNGFGVDLGALYEVIPEKLTVGLKVTDILSDIGDEKMPMIVNIGASLKLNEALLLSADYNDFFMHRGASFFNRLYLGGEYSLGNILLARAGFAQGYPSVGAGLNLGAIQIDGAIYGIEKSKSPGGDGDYNYSVRLKIGW